MNFSSPDHNLDIDHDFTLYVAHFIFPVVCLAIFPIVDVLRSVKFPVVITPAALFLLAIIVSQSYKSLLNCYDPNVAAFEQSRTWWGLACHHIMLAVYPIIVFELSFGVEWFHFKKRFVEVALFGFLSFILSCFVFATGTFVILLLWKIECTYAISVFYSSIVMSIDPSISALAIAELNIPKRLRLLLTTESLLNNGMSIILYRMTQSLILSSSESGMNAYQHAPFEIAMNLIFILLSMFCGYVIARATAAILNRTQDNITETSMVVFSVYAVYVICHAFGGGLGILGVVAFGITLNSFKENINTRTIDELLAIWRTFATWAEYVLYILAGVIANVALDRLYDYSTYEWAATFLFALWTYLGTYMARFAPLVLYSTITWYVFGSTKPDYVLPFRFALALTLFGIKGSLSMLMCKKNLDDNKFVFTPSAPIAVVFTIALSTIFNTLSAQCVARRLDFSQLSFIKARRTRLLVYSVNGSVIILCRRFRRLHKNFWSEAVWKNVEQQITLSKSSDDPQVILRKQPHNLAKSDGKQRDSTITKSSHVSDNSLTVSGKGLDSPVGQTQLVDRVTVIDIMLWFTRNMGQKQALSGAAVRCLHHAINEAVDYNRPIDIDGLLKRVNPWDSVRRIDVFGKRKILDRFEAWATAPWIEEWIFGRNVPLSYDFWGFVWHLAVYCHAVLCLLWSTFLEHEGVSKFNHRMVVLFALSFLCGCEILLRFVMQGRKLPEYMKYRKIWRYYDIVRLILYVCSNVSIFIYLNYCQSDSTNFPYSRSICTPIFVLSNCVILILIHVLAWISFLLLRVGFGYLHEYVVAADQMAIEMMFSVVMMSEYVMSVLERVDDTILESKIDRMRLQQENLQMKRNAENHIISIINVQPVGSKRLIYTKTRQLARIMIREAFTYLDEKMKSGEVDDHEYETVRELLQQKIEMTREFFTFDKQPPPLFDESRLDLIPWIRLSEKRLELIRFIMSHLEDRIFSRKHFLMIQGRQSDGVFYLVSGICRFAVRLVDSLKPLHLLYAGRFVGESVFFTSSGPGIPARPIRSGSVYAETSVICKFLPIRHVAHIFDIDPTVKEKFEENTAVYRCHDLMRRIREYTVWTTPALDKFIRTNWVVCQHETLIDRIDAVSQIILIKVSFFRDDAENPESESVQFGEFFTQVQWTNIQDIKFIPTKLKAPVQLNISFKSFVSVISSYQIKYINVIYLNKAPRISYYLNYSMQIY